MYHFTYRIVGCGCIDHLDAIVTLTAVIIVVMVVVILYFAGTRYRRGQLTIYDTPYNYQLPLPATNPDAAISARSSPSPVHSAKTDLPFERANDGTDLSPSNPGLGETMEDSTGSAENSNCESRVPSTGAIYANDRNSDYKTNNNIATTSEMETSENITHT